jgi:hypothetical protein
MSHITLFDESGPSPPDPRIETGQVDLDRLVWDPEYRAEVLRTHRPSITAANDDTPPPQPVRTVA